jgi:hypothetical protein
MINFHPNEIVMPAARLSSAVAAPASSASLKEELARNQDSVSNAMRIVLLPLQTLCKDNLMRLCSVLAVLACSLSLAIAPSLAQLGPPGPGPGPAASQILTKVTPEQVAAALIQAGYPSQVQTSNNQKYVSSKLAGFNILVRFADCDNQGCGNYGFVTWFQDKVTLNFVNAWNAQYRFAKADIDSDGDVEFSSDALAAGGVTLENVKENARAYAALLSALTQFKP